MWSPGETGQPICRAVSVIQSTAIGVRGLPPAAELITQKGPVTVQPEARQSVHLLAAVTDCRSLQARKEGKEFGVPLEAAGFTSRVNELLAEIQSSLFQEACTFRDANIKDVNSYEELQAVVEQGFWARGPWAGKAMCKKGSLSTLLSGRPPGLLEVCVVGGPALSSVTSSACDVMPARTGKSRHDVSAFEPKERHQRDLLMVKSKQGCHLTGVVKETSDAVTSP